MFGILKFGATLAAAPAFGSCFWILPKHTRATGMYCFATKDGKNRKSAIIPTQCPLKQGGRAKQAENLIFSSLRICYSKTAGLSVAVVKEGAVMQHIKFLVVDDCQTVLSVVRSTLVNRLGAEKIYTAKNGLEALEILKVRDIDIVISDWEMPQLSGEELLYQVRNHHRDKDIPFIMMTSRGGRDFVITAVQNGVSQYVVKPFTADRLEDAIHKSWNGAKKRNSVRLSGLPSHKACLYTHQDMLTAEVKNISSTGLLLQLAYSEQLKLFNQYQLDIKIAEFGHDTPLNISKLKGTVIRIEADDAYDSGSNLCNVALRLVSDAISDKTRTNLATLLEHLSTSVPKVIDNT